MLADIPSSPHIPAVLSSHSIYIRLQGTKAVIFFSFPSQLGGYYKVGWGRSQPDDLIWRPSLTSAFLLHNFHLWGQGFLFTSVSVQTPAECIGSCCPCCILEWPLSLTRDLNIYSHAIYKTHKLYMFLFLIKYRWPIHFSQNQWFMPQIHVTGVTSCLRAPYHPNIPPAPTGNWLVMDTAPRAQHLTQQWGRTSLANPQFIIYFKN